MKLSFVKAKFKQVHYDQTVYGNVMELISFKIIINLNPGDASRSLPFNYIFFVLD